MLINRAIYGKNIARTAGPSPTLIHGEGVLSFGNYSRQLCRPGGQVLAASRLAAQLRPVLRTARMLFGHCKKCRRPNVMESQLLARDAGSDLRIPQITQTGVNPPK